MYVNKIQNRIIFMIKTRYYLEYLTPETIKLLESNIRRITESKSGEDVLQLEITEMILVHCNFFDNQY